MEMTHKTNHRGYNYYQEAQDQISKMDKKLYLSRLTPEQKRYYTQYLGWLRQTRFSSITENKDRYNRIRNEHIKDLRTSIDTQEKMREENLKDVNNYRMRNKAKLNEILTKQKSSQTLTDAIRARKAKAEMNKLRIEKENREKVKNDVSSILNSIIDAVPIKSKNKKNSEAVARHKQRKTSGEAKTYMTRSKRKMMNS